MSAITFTKKTYSDTASSGSGLVAADMNKIEQAIVDLNNAVTKLQDSVSNVTELYRKDGWIIYYKNDVVYVYINGVQTSSDSWAYVYCPYQLPKQYRPREIVNVAAVTSNGGSCTGILYIDKKGWVYVKNMGSSGSSEPRWASASWPV